MCCDSLLLGAARPWGRRVPAAKLLVGTINTAHEGQGAVFLIKPCLNTTLCYTTILQDRA